LTRFTFDALLGLSAIRAHGAQQAVSVEHENLLVEWARASHRLLRWRVIVDGLQTLAGITLAAWLLMTHASHTADATGVLLLAYWALNIPALGDEIALLVHQYPSHRNVALRLLEPLGAPEQESLAIGGGATTVGNDPVSIEAQCGPATRATIPAAIRLKNVGVRAAGHTILESLDLDIPAQSHVAIVGPSGAGKSSLVGLLLGWHQAASGQVQVDGQPLDGPRLAALRAQTVWVDPAVQLWNRSLLENLLYGNPGTGLDQVGHVVQQADLYDVLQRLPDGLQTPLGESGGLLSGGEGQRVKLGRGFARHGPRLVILDEPFRGLERERRRVLLDRARSLWRSATLICITHDVSETLEFPRVLVLDAGRLVEDASPQQLLARPDSLYRSLLDAEHAVRSGLWGSSVWRRLQLRSGRIAETAATEGTTP
jgi:ATP-binding cassette subfamily B protein